MATRFATRARSIARHLAKTISKHTIRRFSRFVTRFELEAQLNDLCHIIPLGSVAHFEAQEKESGIKLETMPDWFQDTFIQIKYHLKIVEKYKQ